MKLKTITLMTTLLGSLVAAPVMAADTSTAIGKHVERRGDRIQRHLDNKGNRINNRLDRRANHAAANGHDKRAARLDRTGNRINRQLDRTGRRIDHRTDRFARRH